MASILIVEDRPIDRKFLATLLKSAGHTVAKRRTVTKRFAWPRAEVLIWSSAPS